MARPQGIGVRYTIRNQAIARQLSRLLARGQNLRPVFMEIGERLVESTQERFETKLSPQGKPWSRTVSDDYARRKQARKATGSPGDARTTDPRNVNVLTYRLHDNIACQASSTDLVVGSAEAYAPVRNFDRQFLGLSAQDKDAIRDLLQDHLDASQGSVGFR